MSNCKQTAAESAQCGYFMIFLSCRFYAHEINFEDSSSAKSAILTLFKALNFDFHDYLHFFNPAFYQMYKIHRP